MRPCIIKMIFLDSSFIIACAVGDDVHHKKAMALLNSIIENNDNAVISDYIFDEVLTVLMIKTKNVSIAVKIGEVLRNSAGIFGIDNKIFDNAWRLFKSQKETRLSFTDCTNISIMKDKGIIDIATFDKEFTKIIGIKAV